MKKWFSQLMGEDSAEKMIKVLFSWRIIMLGAFVGAVMAWAVYTLFPPDFRAQATVVVDHNTEEAWVYFPDRQLFHFLERETQKLEAVAWADETLALVTAKVAEVSVEDLRDHALVLSYPSDGAWHFYGVHKISEIAEALAAAWAEAFALQAWEGIEISPQLEAARNELEDMLAEDPATPWEQIGPFWERIDALHEESKGISPYIEITLSEIENLPASRTMALSSYLLGGSVLGVLGLIILAMFFLEPGVKND